MTIKDIKSLLNAIIAAKAQRDDAIKEAYTNYNAAAAMAAVTYGAEIDFILPPGATYESTVKIGFTLYGIIKDALRNSSEADKLGDTIKVDPDNFAIEYNGYIFSAVNRI